MFDTPEFKHSMDIPGSISDIVVSEDLAAMYGAFCDIARANEIEAELMISMSQLESTKTPSNSTYLDPLVTCGRSLNRILQLSYIRLEEYRMERLYSRGNKILRALDSREN